MEPKYSHMLPDIQKCREELKRHQNLMQLILQKISNIKYEGEMEGLDEGARVFDWELKYTGEWSEMLGAGECVHIYDQIFQPIMLDFNYFIPTYKTKNQSKLLKQILDFYINECACLFATVSVKNNIERIKLLTGLHVDAEEIIRNNTYKK